jgi:hypothetical protein
MLARPAYAALLDAFAASLVDDSATPVALQLATLARVSVYRNNVRLNRIAALTDAFPNVVQLVGLDYFQALARAYVDATPARSANLHEDGAPLPAFIRQFEKAADLPYLADVAEVDWRLHRAYFALDVEAIDSAAIAALGQDGFAEASLRLVPSVHTARSSRWPIADILAMHEGGPPANLDAGGQAVLIWREAFAVRWQPLGPAETEAMALLMAGRSIQTAFEDTGADATWLLSQLFGRRLVHAIEKHDHETHL